MRDMYPVGIQHLQILRENECYPPLFKRPRGRPKERKVRDGKKKRGVCREACKWPAHWKMFRAMLRSVVMWVARELLVMHSISFQLYTQWNRVKFQMD